MVPAVFIHLEALPRTPTGKVGRRALRASSATHHKLNTAYVAPRTPIETTLADIWATVLGCERVGIHDHFLELGGHSLLAMRIIGQVRDMLRLDMPPHALLEVPTVADMAVLVAQHFASATAQETRLRMLTEVDEGEKGPEA
jgi:acyl carrier protein